MRLYYLLTSTILSTILIFTSCEEPVDLELDAEAKIVVTSHFSANKALVVFVSETIPSISNDVESEYIENATISVFAGNEFIEVMEFVFADDYSYYRTQKLNPIFDEVYTIKVNIPGHEPITATNYIPTPVPIQNVTFDPVIGNDVDDNVLIDFDITVSIQDPPGQDNYYHIYFYQELIPFEINEDGDTIFSDIIDLNTPINISLSNVNFPADKNFDKRSFLIKDGQYDGTLMTIGFNGNYSFAPSHFVPGDFLVELRTVSKEYYDYYTSVNTQTGSNGGPLDDATVLDDNIVNGEGIFVGYSTSVNSSKLQD